MANIELNGFFLEFYVSFVGIVFRCYGYEGDEGEGGKGSGGGRREAGIVVAAFVCSLLLLYEEM